MTQPADVPMSPDTAMMPWLGDGGSQARTFADVVRFCKVLSESGLFGVKSKETNWKLVPLSWQQCFVRIQHGAEIGLSMMQSMWNIYDVYGRPHVQVETAWGLVLRSGELEDSGEEWDGAGDHFGCTFWAKPRGAARLARTFTLADAKAAGLVKPDSAWEKWLERMLYQRAKGFVVKDAFPHILHGLGCAADDEIAPMRNVTPAGAMPGAGRPAPAGADPLMAALGPGEERTIELPVQRERELVEVRRTELEETAQQLGDRRDWDGLNQVEAEIEELPTEEGPNAPRAPVVIPPELQEQIEKRMKHLALVKTAEPAARAELEEEVREWVGLGSKVIVIAQAIRSWKPAERK